MATIFHREHKAPISFIISMQGFIWKTFHIAPSLQKWSNQIVPSRLLQIQGSLVQVKIVREWSNQKLVCGSPKVMTTQMLTSSHHEQLGYIGKGGRERVQPTTSRERVNSKMRIFIFALPLPASSILASSLTFLAHQLCLYTLLSLWFHICHALYHSLPCTYFTA